jgi:hypothetical protein
MQLCEIQIIYEEAGWTNTLSLDVKAKDKHVNITIWQS